MQRPHAGAAAGEISNHARNSVMAELRSRFRPEFLNRVDDTVIFKPLTLQELTKIVDLQVNDIRKRLAERRVELVLTDAARQHLAEAGYDPVYGARPLKRYLQHEVETRVGRAIVAGEVEDGATITLDVDEQQALTVTVRNEKQAP